MAAIFDLRHTHVTSSIIIFTACYGTENVLIPSEVCCYCVYQLIYMLLQYVSRHLRFLTAGFILKLLLIAPLKSLTPKHVGSRWTYVPISCIR